jgi:hypothetical protein
VKEELENGKETECTKKTYGINTRHCLDKGVNGGRERAILKTKV